MFRQYCADNDKVMLHLERFPRKTILSSKDMFLKHFDAYILERFPLKSPNFVRNGSECKSNLWNPNELAYSELHIRGFHYRWPPPSHEILEKEGGGHLEVLKITK